MKKYFLVETDEVCEFGDVLNLTFFKDLENGRVTVEKEVKFTEDTMDWMIEMGFVQEREVEEEEQNDLIDFGEPCEELSDLIEDFEALEKRVEKLEEGSKVIAKIVADMNKMGYDFTMFFHELVKELDEKKKKTAQPKKK